MGTLLLVLLILLALLGLLGVLGSELREADDEVLVGASAFPSEDEDPAPAVATFLTFVTGAVGLASGDAAPGDDSAGSELELKKTTVMRARTEATRTQGSHGTFPGGFRSSWLSPSESFS